jgi:MFS family permease
MTEKIQEGTPEGLVDTSQAGSSKIWHIAWPIALCILAIGTTIYSETEGQWFNSYMVNVGLGVDLDVAIMVALRAIIGTIFYLVWGAIGDNIRPKKMGHRVAMILVGCLCTAGLMLLFTTSTAILFLIICGGVLLATSSNMVHVNNRALIADLTPENRRGKINMMLSIMSTIGSLAIWIPTVTLLPGGVTQFTAETHAIFIGLGALVIGVTGITTWLLVKQPAIAKPTRTWLQDLRGLLRWKEMKQHSGFLKLFLAKIFMLASTAAYYPFLLLLLQNIDFDTTTMIFAIPLIGVPVGLGFFLAGKYTDIVGRKRVAIICLLCAPVGGLFISLLGENLWMMLVGFGIMMPFTAGLNIATDSWALDLLPKESRGRFAGVLNLGNALGTSAGVLIAGVISTAFSRLWIFLVAGVILWAAIPFFLRVPEIFKREEKIE